MLNTITEFIKTFIPLIPTIFVAYAVIKLLSSGLSLVAKMISTFALVAMCIWAVNYLMLIMA